MDEACGRNVAATEEGETCRTAYLIALLTKQGIIERDTARETIDTMLDTGWFCAPDTYAQIVRTTESF